MNLTLFGRVLRKSSNKDQDAINEMRKSSKWSLKRSGAFTQGTAEFILISFCMEQHDDVLAALKTWFLKLTLFGAFTQGHSVFKNTHFYQAIVFLE